MTVTARSNSERIELPNDVAEALGRVADREDPPRTLREGLSIVATVAGDAYGSLTLDDIYRSEPTRHAVHVDDTVEHVPCVLDAMIVAMSLDERPVEIRSEQPDGGDTVQFRVTDGGVSVTPDGAVVSFGIPQETHGTDGDTITASLTDPTAVPETCSLINAFTGPDAYDRWASDVSNAAVMQLTTEELVAVAEYVTRRIRGNGDVFDSEIATRLATAFDLDRPPRSVAELVVGVTETFEASLDRSLRPRDMCTTDDSPHEARVGDETYRYQCVLDAFILGLLLDDPVTVQTVCRRSGAQVTVEFDDGWSVDSAPENAVMSYGVSRSVARPEGEITPEKLYGDICGYSHVFASREAYEEWDRATPDAVTQAWPLAEGIEVAERMVAAFESLDDARSGSTVDFDCCD